MKILLAFILATLVFIAYTLYTNSSSQLSLSPNLPPQVEENSPTLADPTPTTDPHPGWLSYTHPTLGFTISYPPTYKIVEDNYGWPKAVFMLYAGGQSYDLVIEKWDTLAQYQAKYPNANNVTLLNDSSFYYSLLNMNYSPEVDDIISTFKL